MSIDKIKKKTKKTTTKKKPVSTSSEFQWENPRSQFDELIANTQR